MVRYTFKGPIMRRSRASILVTLLIVLVFTWSSEQRASTDTSGPSYSVQDLGTLGGPTAVARGVGGAGWLIAGTSVGTDGRARAFVREFMQPPRDLGTLGGLTSEARGVDRSGYLVVGRAQTSSGSQHAFYWIYTYPARPMIDLGTLGGSESIAYAVNEHGVTVGASKTTGDAATRAFISTRGGPMTPLPVTLGGSNSVAFGINDAGRIVGQASLSGETHWRAFVFADGETTALPTPGGDSAAMAINDFDQIVGFWEATDKTSSRAFLHEAGHLETLPTLGGAFTYAHAINRDGVVVGESDTPGGARRAVIWVNRQIRDLNSLIPAGSGWVLQAATSISDYGQIVGYGLHNGVLRAFLLAPPADMALSLSNHENYVDTNIPNPHEAGRRLDLGVTVRSYGDSFVTGIEVTDTITGPIEYLSWDTDVADCTQAGQTLTCRLKRNLQPGGHGITLMIRARSTGAGPITHSATARADQLDSDLANNSATEANTAVSLASLTLTPTTVVGGESSLGRATLTSRTPRGGARVVLSSSHPAVASVPDPFHVLPDSHDGLYREFWVRTTPVTVPTPVQISATYGLVTRTVTLTVLPAGSTPFRGMAHALPGTIQAEDFDEGGSSVAYYDTTPGNRGGQYRETDVDIEATTDAGGGYNVGWTRPGEWLHYTAHVAAAGTYTLRARVAAVGAGGRLRVSFNGVDKTGPLAVPDTGGWQAWTTISTPVTLEAGTQVMRVVFDAAGSSGGVGNVNWIRLDAQSPAFGGTPRALPGTVQAEDFDVGANGVAYSDTTPGNRGGQYRETDVDIEATTDTGGGYNVGWTRAGEWLTYTVQVAAAGTYTLHARVAAVGSGGTFRVEFDGADKTGPVAVPDTGGWQAWSTVSRTVTLAAGTQVMRVVFIAPGTSGGVGNLNWVRLETASQPFGGTPRALPGIVQAEDFDVGPNGVAYHDTTPGNRGGQYRATDVDIEVTSDTGGGHNVGWIAAGEWLTYTVQVTAAGTYTLHARVAANGPGGTFRIEFDGVDRTGPITIPDTGGWQAWRTVSRTVTLPAGRQVMRVVLDTPSTAGIIGNLNYVAIE
jgi:probable HAF family extracellular repeat protein